MRAVGHATVQLLLLLSLPVLLCRCRRGFQHAALRTRHHLLARAQSTHPSIESEADARAGVVGAGEARRGGGRGRAVGRGGEDGRRRQARRPGHGADHGARDLALRPRRDQHRITVAGRRRCGWRGRVDLCALAMPSSHDAAPRLDPRVPRGARQGARASGRGGG
eukprot:2003645-Rhodomonas_salina.1